MLIETIESFKNSTSVNELTYGPYELRYMSDGILYVQVKEMEHENEWFEFLKGLPGEIGKISNFEKVPILVWHNDFVLPSQKHRELWAKSEASPYSSAEAFIMNSTAMKLIGNFYMNMNKPGRPTKLFSDPNEAVSWLKTFL